MPRRRVDWEQDEVDKVVDEVVRLYLSDPELTVSALFEQSQQILPPERRRAINAFASAKNILLALKERLAVVSAIYAQGGGQEAKSKQERDQQIRQDLENQVQQLQQTVGALRSENEQLRAQPGPQQILESASTETLFFLVLRRFVGAFATQRVEMEQFLATELSKRLSGERHMVENRLLHVEQLLLNLSRSNDLAIVPRLPIDAKTYMPDFCIAGMKRQDFQRLQMSFSKANIRFKNLDVSQPSKISYPVFDRLFVWTSGLGKDLAASIALRGGEKAVVVTGTINDLQGAIIREAEVVRVEKING